MKLRSLALSLLLILGSSSAFSAQEVKVENNGTYKIKISANELTRISVEGGRVQKAWAINTAWDTKPDKDSGELFIRPKDGSKQAFSFFVQDSFGETFTIIAAPFDIPSETVVLKPSALAVSKAKAVLGDSQPFVLQIKTIVKDMEEGNKDSYLIEEIDQDVALWDEADIKLVKRYTGTNLIGEEYVLVNKTGKDVIFSEQEFGSFGSKVKAVALGKLKLPAHEGMRFFIVRGM